MATSKPHSAEVIAAALRATGRALFRARGGSMWPLIPDGALIEVRPGAPGLGDIAVRALAGDSGGVLVHRVIACTRDEIITQGDALLTPDHPASPSQFLGVVVRIHVSVNVPVPIPLDGHFGRAADLLLRHGLSRRLLLPARRTVAAWLRKHGLR